MTIEPDPATLDAGGCYRDELPPEPPTIDGVSFQIGYREGFKAARSWYRARNPIMSGRQLFAYMGTTLGAILVGCVLAAHIVGRYVVQ